MNGTISQIPQPFLSKEEEALLKRTILKNFPEDEQESFIRICQRTHLDPFTRQIYATKRYQKVRGPDGQTARVPTLVPVTGIMGLTAVADRTGNYDGCEISWSGPDGAWQSEWLNDADPAAAKCIVYRRNRTHPEVAIARWFSYVGQTWDSEKRAWEVSDFWAKMPDYMLGKCAKAQALRGAFPDHLANVYIREELESNLSDAETEEIPSDEQRIAANQRAEDQVLGELLARGKLSGGQLGVKIVESKPGTTRPSPQEALEPAFPEDKIPAKPIKAPPPPAPRKTVTSAPTPVPAEVPPDDLDMSPAAAAAQPPQEALSTPPGDGASSQQESVTPWKEHVILGVAHVKFHKRRIGELNAQELAIIENQWLPAVRSQWDDATDEQRADADAFEAAIAYAKMVKPW